jgi:hypothetical protein
MGKRLFLADKDFASFPPYMVRYLLNEHVNSVMRDE